MWTARILEVPGCISEGESPNDAVANLDEALAGIVATLLEDGAEIPEPRGVPAARAD